MKLKSFIFFSFFCLTAGAQSVFQKFFSEFTEYQKFCVSSFDNSYVLAGSRWSEGPFYDFCAVKVDKNGTVLWSKSFSSPNDDFLSGLSVSSSGEIFLSGYKSSGSGDFDFLFMKLDASGDVQWSKTFGMANSEISLFTGRAPDGNFYLSGNRDINERPMVVKTNNSGTILWSKTFGTISGEEEALGAAITKEGGVSVFGVLASEKNFLMKINPDGTTAWANSYAGQHTQLIYSIKQTSDGGFVLASSDYRCDNTGCHSYFSLIKLDPSGSVSWAKAVEGYLGAGRNALETSDGGFVFTGQLKDSVYNKLVLIKTDNNGNLLWVKSYGNREAFGEGFFVDQTSDDGFVLLGIEDSKAYLIKTDANGNSSCNEKALYPVLSNMNFAKSASIVFPEATDADITNLQISADTVLPLKDSTICLTLGINEISFALACAVYPNPFVGSATLKIPDDYQISAGTLFMMYDVFGRKVMRLPLTDHQLLIPRRNLPSGIYFYEVRNGEKIIGSGKMIAE